MHILAAIRLTLLAAAFPALAQDTASAGWVAMPMNAGRALTRGLELETKFP